MLWIAFIFQYLWDTKQLTPYDLSISFSCELLSFFSIFGIQNNLLMILCQIQYVVNCFHFSVSLGYKTTRRFISYKYISLWIAFIFQYLWDTKQLDLDLAFEVEVVNCFGYAESPCFPFARFHFSVSLGYKTTFGIFLC